MDVVSACVARSIGCWGRSRVVSLDIGGVLLLSSVKLSHDGSREAAGRHLRPRDEARGLECVATRYTAVSAAFTSFLVGKHLVSH